MPFLFGGVGGPLFGYCGMKLIESWIPSHIRVYLINYGPVDLDFATLAFTLGVTLLCGLVFGLAPAFENARLDVNRTLKEASGSKRSARLREIFVGAEIALAVVVLISATLLVKSFVISERSSPGYNPANVMVAQLALPRTKYVNDSQRRGFGEEVLARIRALPGVVSAGPASHVAFGGFGKRGGAQPAGRLLQPGERTGHRYLAVAV